MFRRLSLLTTLCLLAAAGVARSTTVIPPTFDQLVAEAQTVFVGEVVSQRSVMDTSSQGRSIHTIVTFRVEDVWKGTLGAMTQLEFLGGTVGDLNNQQDIVGTGMRAAIEVGARFQQGEIGVDLDDGRQAQRVLHSDDCLAETGLKKNLVQPIHVTAMKTADWRHIDNLPFDQFHAFSRHEHADFRHFLKLLGVDAVARNGRGKDEFHDRLRCNDCLNYWRVKRRAASRGNYSSPPASKPSS